MMMCTSCGEPVVDGQSAIFGIDCGDGTLVFGWTCCHKPVGDVAVLLASETCMTKWLRENPEYVEAVVLVLASHRTHGTALDNN